MARKSVPLRLLLTLLLGITGTALAESSPLSADVQPLTLRPRTGAPSYIDIHLHVKASRFLDGTLEIEGWSGRAPIFRLQIPDLTLAPGVSHQRLLLPPAAFLNGADEVQLRFSTANGAYDLGRFPIAGLNRTSRSYDIGICREEGIGAGPHPLAWQALRPERFSAEVARKIATAPVSFSPEDFPTPAGLCVFDVVMVDGPALAALTARQLNDLAVWVEAGGSLCVIPTEPLAVEHVAFLNRLAGTASNPLPIGRNSAGKLLRSNTSPVDAHAKDRLLFRRAKLGRCVIAFEPPPEETGAPMKEWEWATNFLQRQNSVTPNDLQARGYFSSSALFDAIQQRLIQSLPHTMQMIPLPTISGILGVFVVLIGPGEWFILGRLRRRRWTWLTFPILAVGCALFTVHAAERYLGRNDQQATLVITDFCEDGRPLRENRFDLWFSARNQDAVSEWHDALTVPCGNMDLGGGSPTMGGRIYVSPNSTSINEWEPSSDDYAPGSSFPVGPGRFVGADQEPGVPLYRGRLPGHYTLREAINQWTPYFQRTLSFAPSAPPAPLRWEAAEIDLKTKRTLDLSGSAMKNLGAQGWRVSAFHYGRMRDASSRELMPKSDTGTPRGSAYYLAELLAQAAPAISPSGGTDLFDLAIDHRPEDWIVVAERQVGNEIHIQRCVYHLSDDE